MKYLLVLVLTLPLAAISQTKADTIYANDIYHEYPMYGNPAINGKAVTVKMTCSGFQVPAAKPVQIRFNCWAGGENKNEPLLVVDGCETDFSALKYINPYAIESINVLKDSIAIEKYGIKGQHGVISVKLKCNTSDESVKPTIVKPVPKP